MQVINLLSLAIWSDSWIQVCIPMLWKDPRSQEFVKVFSFILEYRYAVLPRGMQLSELTKSKCSLVDLSDI
jgi:hypothetical protein